MDVAIGFKDGTLPAVIGAADTGTSKPNPKPQPMPKTKPKTRKGGENGDGKGDGPQGRLL
jgi:hypothetical protein